MIQKDFDATIIVGQRQAPSRRMKMAIERGLGDVDADEGRNRIVLHGGYPALRMRTIPPERDVQPAVRVKYTRPPTIWLCDDVVNVRTRSICRRPTRRAL